MIKPSNGNTRTLDTSAKALLNQLNALRQRETCGFVVGNGHRHNEFIKQARCTASHIFMTKRDRVERAAVNRCALHCLMPFCKQT
jgi:hypothetical protein